MVCCFFFFFFKQKTAYEMCGRDWSSDVCSSDLIEARSCERFALIAPRLPESLARFYRGLLASEARHFEHYLALARDAAERDDDVVTARLAILREPQPALIAMPTDTLRFHSGPPAAN